jgi:hypothetical protein
MATNPVLFPIIRFSPSSLPPSSLALPLVFVQFQRHFCVTHEILGIKTIFPTMRRGGIEQGNDQSKRLPFITLKTAALFLVVFAVLLGGNSFFFAPSICVAVLIDF